MSREFCEACGKVTVSYVEEHYNPERVQEVATKSFGSAAASDR